ncbi:MerR family transcriptional regulator [Amycolatopsis azurea]|uniref:MerR family transcriptional regulator n=1 Tax=Amycolatopsis azurea TaxID=36819 RepID=UPI00381C3715
MSDDVESRRIQLDIGELAELAKMQTSALRFYEREGLLAPAGRSSGRRVFDEHGLLQLAAIDFWQEAGFTIKEIAELLNGSSTNMADAKKVASARLAEIEQLIEQAAHVKDFLSHVLSCVHSRLSDCPSYHEHLQIRADEIINGSYERDNRLRLHLLRRPASSSPPERSPRSESDTGRPSEA